MFLIPWGLTDNVLLNTGIFVGPYCQEIGLDVAVLQSENLKPLKREYLTVSLVLELWKQKESIKQMQQWITALTPLELQKYLSSVTSQNLNKWCSDLKKKSQKLSKNKKKEKLDQAEWFNATVLCLAEDIPDGVDAINADYVIKYDIDEDEDEWTMPLLKDLDEAGLILLN